MDAEKILKENRCHVKKYETVAEETDDAFRHILVKREYFEIGSYVLIKDEVSFHNHSPIYGFNDKMFKSCNKIFKIIDIIKDIKYDNVYELVFEKPENMLQKFFEKYVQSYSWNNEMIIPLEKDYRRIRI
jgi:hypothetical protein